MTLKSLRLLPGLLVCLIIGCTLVLGAYMFVDWRFVLITVPVGIAVAFIGASAINWWAEHR